MKPKSSFRGTVQTAWDATSLSLARACPRKYYYTMIRGIKGRHTSVHLLFGGLFATALEHFYKHRASGDSIDDALRKVVSEALIDSWDHEAGQPLEFDSPAKTRPNLIRTIVWYVDQYAVETDDGLQTYHLQDGKPAVELSFSLEFTPDILYCGHLDRVVSMGDQLYVMDQKTTGTAVSTWYFNTFSPNDQMSGYAFAGQSILHTPVKGVIIDAAQIAVSFTRFARGITTRSNVQLDEWYHGVIWDIKKFQELASYAEERAELWPMNPTACGNYGGCEFRILCQKAPKIRESYIESEFKPHHWDPIERR